jgi:ubiquinone/menaquinone biosynthesis C-methylase UbiE
MGNIEKFDAIARKYDTAERCEVADAIAEHIRRNLVNTTDKYAMDYGCGTGLVGLHLLDVFRHILFVDAAPNMIETVKHKIDTGHITNADVFLCDLMLGQTPALCCDYIIVVQVFLHVKDVAHLLRRLRSVLNVGGHLLIVDFDKNGEITSEDVHNGFEQEELAAEARLSGFVDIKSSTFYHGSKIFMNKDASLFMLDAVNG